MNFFFYNSNIYTTLSVCSMETMVQGMIVDNCLRVKPKEEGGYLAVISRVAMV